MIRRALVIVASGVLASLALTPAANASPSNANRYACVINLASHTEDCFSSYRESIAFATGGRITDAPQDVRVAVKDAAFTAEVNASTAAASSVIIATLYWNINYNASGVDHVFTYSGPSACTTTLSDENYFDSDLGAHDTTNDGTWNNKTSSFKGYNNCWLKLYDNMNFGGASTGFLDDQANLVSIGWNDRANSIIFS
jgi:hypothetical protein